MTFMGFVTNWSGLMAARVYIPSNVFVRITDSNSQSGSLDSPKLVFSLVSITTSHVGINALSLVSVPQYSFLRPLYRARLAVSLRPPSTR
jgi:hypothetical protein